ncbi:hypothetical protein BGX24_006214 [Mortierella sp. AD032]|nr:hypothetical protein BGX24_006214 [Mortierella sp. AD032]
MKFTQLAILLVALVIALTSVVEASKKKSPTQTVACYGDLLGNSHVNAGDSWMIGAVHMASFKGGEKTACFECAKITAGKRSIVVRIIDDCAGCAPNQIDLTATAFKKLAPLNQGVVKTTYEFVRCPSKGNLKWPKSPKVKTH